MLPRYPGWFSATFSGTNFFAVVPPPAGNSDLGGFLADLGPLAPGETRAQARKQNFPVLGTLLGGESGRQKVSPRNSAIFLHFTGPPGGGNRKILVF